MKRFIFFLAFVFSGFLILVSFNSISKHGNDEINLDKWNKEELEKANTAKNCLYMTEDERNVVFYTNLARINPVLFSETILTQYVEENEIKKTNFLTSLYSDLKKTKPMEALKLDSVLYFLAKDYAKTHGEKGQVGHINFSRRMGAYSFAGENCDYGSEKALTIVMDLLIDEGVSGCGHRKNMLTPGFKIVGTAIQPHKTYEVCCVMDFAGSYSTSTVAIKNPYYKKHKKKKKNMFGF
jgi:uncharacterized protein YkwD